MHIVSGEYVYALLSLATLGVLIPFWFYNVFGSAQRGHKLFMGDAGSLTLGYILSLLVIHLSVVDTNRQETGNPDMVFAFSTLLVPMLDVVRVVFHRLRCGKNPFLPDNNHFHHKLLRTGMRVRSVMAAILFVSLFFIGLNMLLIPVMNVTLLLLLDLFLWTLMHLLINRNILVHKKEKDTYHQLIINKLS
jgi:UDP-N-acetylmuramyl pentapeptide phosphotransferase/UDP-N-acetylglucosamine-1-phosphate transferase